MGKTEEGRVTKKIAFEQIAANLAKRAKAPRYFSVEFVTLVHDEMRKAMERAREELEPEPEESVQLRKASPGVPAGARAPLPHKHGNGMMMPKVKDPMTKRKAQKPVNFTRQAELWLKAIGTYALVTENVASARSIMSNAAKNAGLKIKTEHRGGGLVVATVIKEDE